MRPFSLDGTKETNSHWHQLEGSKPMILVDFDHVITRKCLACEDGLKNDGVQEGAKESLIALAQEFRIIIFTGNPNYKFASGCGFGRSYEEIRAFLIKNEIPFDDIAQVKPPACFIIDDRAIHHTSWRNTMKQIARRMEKSRQ
jgi:hypothetical protein